MQARTPDFACMCVCMLVVHDISARVRMCIRSSSKSSPMEALLGHGAALVAATAQQAQEDWHTAEDPRHRGMVMLVTLAAVLTATALASSTPLRTLEGVTREEVRDAIVDAVQNPAGAGRGGRPCCAECKVLKIVVVLEEPRHFHAAVKISVARTFLQFKQALRNRSGFASHWSTTHTEWWSALRYLVHTTEHKPVVDEERVVWTHNGESINVYEESREAWNAGVLKRRREEAELKAAGQAAKAKATPKAQKFERVDFTALVIAQDLWTPSQVITHVKSKCSQAAWAYVQRNQHRLKELLKQVAEWREAEATAELELASDWDLIQKMAQKHCKCQGVCAWSQALMDFFHRNKSTIDGELLAASLAQIIVSGPSKTTRVPLIVGVTNAGKSTVLDPIDAVFGRNAVMHTPALGATMPLANLAVPGKRFLYFDEYEPVKFASVPESRPTVPATTFKKLFAGQSLEIQCSQVFNNGNSDVKWERGIAMTAPLEDLWKPCWPVEQEDIRHFRSRVLQFDALVPIKGVLQPVPLCPESWCKYIVVASQAYAARSMPSAIPVLPLAPAQDPEQGDDELTFL